MELKLEIKKKLPSFTLDLKFQSSSKAIGIIGESGSGKTLTLKVLSGLVEPDHGFVSLGSSSFYDSNRNIFLPPEKREIGYMFQSYALFPHMTAYENVEFVIKAGEKRDKVKDLLQAVYLWDRKDHYPSELSGGQKQRLALARILATSPRLILLDEPFSALDKKLRWKMELEIISLIKDFNIPLILVSHDSEEIYRIGEEVLVLKDGKIVDQGPKERVFKNPSSQFSASLLGYENISPLKNIDGKVFLEDYGISLDLSPLEKGKIGFKAKDISISKGEEGSDPMKISQIIQGLDSTTLILRKDKNFKGLIVSTETPRAFKEGEYVRIALDNFVTFN